MDEEEPTVAQTETAVREVEGVELPPAGTYAFDKTHTSIEFVARHMLSKVRGRFDGFDGKVVIGDSLEDSFAEVEIDAATIETKTEGRDNHLRSADFLDVETFPKLTFRSREIRPTGGSTFELVGDLTIKDVTREVVLEAEFLGVGQAPMPGAPLHVAFSASTEIEREDWDMTWNVAIETGGWLVGKKVRIEIETELQLQA
jgi:polyisoprenoid-binding protein YceI